MGKTKKLDPDGVRALWNRIFSNMKIITGDVDVKNKGTLQAQIDKKVGDDGDASNTSVDFEVAQTRTLPVTGSKTKNIFANVVRWLTDLKPFVFMDLIQNATTNAVDRAVSAAVAKALQDQINELNTNIEYSDGFVTLKRKGNVVTMYFNKILDGVFTDVAYTNILSIPQGYRPVCKQYLYTYRWNELCAFVILHYK